MIAWLRRWFGRESFVSAAWLDEQARTEIDRSAQFEGVPWTRPYDRAKDGNGWRNRALETMRRRRSA